MEARTEARHWAVLLGAGAGSRSHRAGAEVWAEEQEPWIGGSGGQEASRRAPGEGNRALS